MSDYEQQVARWLEMGIGKGAEYLVVLCDIFDHEVYPVFAQSAEEADEKQRNPGQMQRAVGSYDVNAYREAMRNSFGDARPQA